MVISYFVSLAALLLFPTLNDAHTLLSSGFGNQLMTHSLDPTTNQLILESLQVSIKRLLIFFLQLKQNCEFLNAPVIMYIFLLTRYGMKTSLGLKLIQADIISMLGIK